MATVLMSADGASDASSPPPLSRIMEMRRAFNVSAASGVMWPLATSVTVEPYSMTRASGFVIILKRFLRASMLVYFAMDVLIAAADIHERVKQMAQEIHRDHPDGVHLVCVLKGAFIFLSDLARQLPSTSLDFMAVSSYGTSTKSSGQVQVLKDLDSSVEGRDVVIVEDIVDTGLTLTYLQDILRARSPRHLRTACLLSKPSRRKIDVKVEYVGVTIEDKFVVGYGLDYAGQYRNLPYIAVIGD